MKKVGLYYPELDSLRFLAFLLVLLHHSPYMRSVAWWRILSKYGWTGVDLFLCLSAFLFARLLFVEFQEKGDIHVGYFYLRRALRIWPLYFFFMAAMLTISVWQDGWSTYLSLRSIGMATFTDNLFTTFFNYNFAIWFSDHLWTISYEEQFYLIIPWALRLLYRARKFTAGISLTGIMLAGMLIRAVFIYKQVKHPAIWVLPVTHFEAIFGGLILGLGLFDIVLKKIPGWVLLLTGLSALYGVILLPEADTIQWGLMLTYPLLGLGMTLILAAVMQGKLGVVSKLFQNRILRYLGKISFGLYVYHVACIWLANRITKHFCLPRAIAALPVDGTATGFCPDSRCVHALISIPGKAVSGIKGKIHFYPIATRVKFRVQKFSRNGGYKRTVYQAIPAR